MDVVAGSLSFGGWSGGIGVATVASVGRTREQRREIARGGSGVRRCLQIFNSNVDVITESKRSEHFLAAEKKLGFIFLLEAFPICREFSASLLSSFSIPGFAVFHNFGKHGVGAILVICKLFFR